LAPLFSANELSLQLKESLYFCICHSYPLWQLF